MAASGEGVRTILGLYRQILRAHYKQLPAPMRLLGDGYARDEFRRHLQGGKTTHDQWIEFGSEWSKYLSTIAPVVDTAPGSAGERGGGDIGAAGTLRNLSGDLPPEILDAMTGEQKMMLDKLKQEALSFGAGLTSPPSREVGDGDGDDEGAGEKK